MTLARINLHTVRGHNTYCGPAVIAALTGRTTDEAALLLSLHTGRSAITTTKPPEVIAVLRALGLHVARHQAFDLDFDGPSLRDWLTTFAVPSTGVSLVATTGHWQVVAGEYLADNKHRTPLAWRTIRKRYLRDRVEAVWAVGINDFSRARSMP